MQRTSTRFFILILSMASIPTTAQWINYPAPGTPRTADGKPNLTAAAPKGGDGRPDLSGIWMPDFGSAPPIPPGTVIVSSQGAPASLQFWRTKAEPILMTPWAQSIFQERDRGFGVGRPSEKCLPHGIPDAMLVNNFKIVQHPGLTLILYEEFARFRQIFTDGRAHPKDPNPAWLGYSIGKWDGDTFVVDTTGFNDRSWLDDAGHPHSDALRTVERFHRRDFGHMDLEINIDDAKAYTEPWAATVPFRLLPDTELIEDVCDNEKDAAHLVGRSASDDKAIGVAVSPEILSKYVGVYESKIPGQVQVVDVSLSGTRLVVFGTELTPISETEFDSPYGKLQFVTDSRGQVTRLLGGGFEGIRKSK
jgi:hypothetical protein